MWRYRATVTIAVMSGRKRVFQRLLRLSAAAAALAPVVSSPVARADNLVPSLERGTLSFGGGVFVGYAFGARQAVEWGLEAFFTHRIEGVGGCRSDARAGVGPLLQLGVYGLDEPRLTLAAHGGGEFSRGGPSLTGELGLSYRFGPRPGFGIHVGVVPELFLLNVALRYEALRNEAWVGGGVRWLPTYGPPSSCVVGRPHRSAEGVLSVTVEALQPASDDDDGKQRAALGFAADAQLEAASVSAFAQLACELLALGAPDALVHAAIDAAYDELHHAQLCAALSGLSLTPVLPVITARDLSDTTEALVRLAVESWLDGCIGEASAAHQAAAAAALAHDRATQQTLLHIARDEARHGQLAWSVLDFALQRGGEPVRAALRTRLDHQPTCSLESTADRGLERHGRLSAQASLDITRRRRSQGLTQLRERGI